MNYLQAYHTYTKPTEPSQAFHLWCAVHNICALLGRKCYVNQGHFVIFPHLYIMLVGEPASRKSTAINMAKKAVIRLGKVPVAPSSSSRSSLIDTMTENRVEYTLDGGTFFYHQVAAYADEFGEFIGGKHLNSENVKFLTKIWTEDIYEERTRSHGHKRIPYPFFSILGGCPPNWLSANLHHAVISEGFARRMLFVVADESVEGNINAWPSLSEEQKRAHRVIEQESGRIAQISGDFALTSKAMKTYINWYTNNRKAVRKQNTILRFYFSSKHELVLKVCMTVSAAITSKRIINQKILLFVLKALKQLEWGTEKILSGISQNPIKGLGDQIEQEIIKHGKQGIPNKQLLSKVWTRFGGRMSEYKEIIETLLVAGKITENLAGKLAVDSDPVYVSTSTEERLQEVDLFAEVCQIALTEEDSDVVREPVLMQHLVDPTVEKSEEKKKQRESEAQLGTTPKDKRPFVLLKGGDEPS